MSKEEEINKSIKQKTAEENPEQDSSEKNEDEESLDYFKDRMEELYLSRTCFTDLINQSDNRRVNLALILTQFLARYSFNQIVCFLIFAAGFVIIQAVCAFWMQSSQTILFLGFLMNVLIILFIGVTLKNVSSAVIDIRRIKRGYCCLGYQILSSDGSDKNPDGTPSQPLVAYKDYANMIRTLEIPKKNYKKYFVMPVLELFLDNSNPYKVTFLDILPMDITYEHKTHSFTQNWKGLTFTFFPVVMIALYSISMYMSFIAYTTLHQ